MADQTAQTLITAVRALDPFNPMQKRTAQFQVGTTLQTCFDELAYVIPEHQDLVLFLNGQPVMRAGWDYATQAGDHVFIKPFPRGGDNSEFRQVAQIGLAMAAMYVGGPAGAAIMMGGTLALNEFMPLPKPPTPQQVQPFSNTYQSQSRGNVPKPMQAMPEQFGELEIYPDEAARSYFAYEDNKQVYYQLLCVGLGDFQLNLTSLRLGGDVIDLFTNPQTQVVQKGGVLSLVNPTVTSVAINQTEVPDQTLNNAYYHHLRDGASDRGISRFESIGNGNYKVELYDGDYDYYLDFEAGDKFRFIDANNNMSDIATALTPVLSGNKLYPKDIRFSASNTPASVFSYLSSHNDNLNIYDCWPILWDEELNQPKKTSVILSIDSRENISRIQLDLALPKKDDNNHQTVNLTVHKRKMDLNNNPISGWSVVTSEIITRSNNEDLYITKEYSVPSGRYQLKIHRNDYGRTPYDQFLLTGLKGIGVTTANASIAQNCTLLALKVEVPESKNITLGETRVVAKRKLPVLQANGTWSAPQATSQISAAIAEALRIRYGSDFENYLMPLDELYALQQTWTARGDEFNGRFDQQVVLKEAMQLIARVGRAVALEVGDRWYIIRDEPGVATYPYGPANIVADPNTAEPYYSLQDKYPLPDDPDGIIVEFFNRDVWEWDETPSYPTNAVQPKRIRFFGITDKLHAWRECCYLYYREIIKPTTITWRTELEALNHGYGDLISIAPPKSRIYGAGVIEAFNAVTGELELSEPPQWSDSGYHFINLRRDNGSMSGPYEVRKGATDYHCILKPGTALDMTPHNGITVTPQREPTHYQFGKTSTGLLVRLIGRKSVGTHTFDMLGEIETDAKHTVDQTPYPA